MGVSARTLISESPQRRSWAPRPGPVRLQMPHRSPGQLGFRTPVGGDARAPGPGHAARAPGLLRLGGQAGWEAASALVVALSGDGASLTRSGPGPPGLGAAATRGQGGMCLCALSGRSLATFFEGRFNRGPPGARALDSESEPVRARPLRRGAAVSDRGGACHCHWQ
jgi:hypothetical protein